MSRLGRNLFGKRLEQLLGRADDEGFIELMWSAYAIQSGREEAVVTRLSYPPEAATQDMAAPHRIFPWDIETLINELLARPKARRFEGRQLHLNFRLYASALQAARLLRRVENADDGISLARVSVFREMHRIAQRQFEWQRGFVNYAAFYRMARIFGGPACSARLEGTHGVCLADYSYTAHVLHAYFLSQPVFNPTLSLASIGISDAVRDRVLALITRPHVEARERAGQIRSARHHTAYRRSVLRETPCIAFGANSQRVRAPLPELVVHRVTNGVYYDLVGGGSPVSKEIGDNFETYCLEFLRASLSGLTVEAAEAYRHRGNRVASPDILIRQNGSLRLVLECKAKRLTYEARFSEDPLSDAESAYAEIVKGVFQLWRYFSHVRRGIAQAPVASSQPIGIVLTLDPWLTMANELQDGVLARAEAMAAEDDPEIAAEDRRRVAFCSIEELEYTLSRASDASFLEALRIATDGNHDGWLLSSIHMDLEGSDVEREYPFDDIAARLPWYGELERARAELGAE